MTRRHVCVALAGILFVMWVAAPAEARRFRFTVTAESQSNDMEFRSVLLQITKQTGGPGEFHITVGDTDPLPLNLSELSREFGAFTWYPAVGHREAQSGSDMRWLRDHYLTLPFIANPGPPGSESTTYSFNYNHAHFIILNQYYDGVSDRGGDGDVCDALYNWLVADLEANTKPVVFVIGHEPAFPEPSHGGSSLDVHPFNRDRFWQLLNDEKVIAYLCSHTHSFSRKTVPGPEWSPVTWQVNVGAARLAGDKQTFLDVTVTDTEVFFAAWRGAGRARDFEKEDVWKVVIPGAFDKTVRLVVVTSTILFIGAILGYSCYRIWEG